jgi:hypothetical protein
MSLNHLRFSESVWESESFRHAAFYTNRLRLSQLIALCREVGFEVELPEVNRWDRLPVAREKLAPPFRTMADDDLNVKTIRIVLRANEEQTQ